MTTPVTEPVGPSEFSHGRGLMVPIDLADPTQSEQLHAVYRTNSADPGDTAEAHYEDWVRE